MQNRNNSRFWQTHLLNLPAIGWKKARIIYKEEDEDSVSSTATTVLLTDAQEEESEDDTSVKEVRYKVEVV